MSTSKRHIIFSASLATGLLLTLTCCIKNDIPYPRIQPSFTRFVVEGQSEPAVIDSLECTVTLTLGEEADIEAVRVTDYAISQGGWLADASALDSPLDLTNPVTIDLQLYQTYPWRIIARQDMERYFTVASQIGSSTIDVPGRRVVFRIPESLPLNAVQVLTMKLGSPSATYSPELAGQTVDFSLPVVVEVTDYGRTSRWTIYAEHSEEVVSLTAVDPWSCVAWLYGQAEEGKDNGFEYRLEGASDWIRIPQEMISFAGGSFSCCLSHLQSETNYEVRAYSDNDYSTPQIFTTEGTQQIPNGTMDSWWLDGKVWNPWAEGSEPYWDTGNKGATTLGSSNSVPTDDTSSGTGRAAKLETRFVGIGILGKIAAGNLFAGRYVRTDGTNGILDFGRQYTLRPTRLRGYFKYHSAPISHTTSGFENIKGKPDTCIIWCALIDADAPFEIRTNPNNRNLFDPSAPDVVAYGKMETGTDVTEYRPFDIKLDYKSTARKPRYILIVASASKYGDYFTGGNGSVLYVDDFVLDYDYQ